MKKFLAMILALVLAFSMSTVAFAASTITSAGGTDSADVKAKISSVGTEYCVLIEWDSLEFTYNKTAGEWNEKTHAYSGNAGWENPDRTILVENHSNAAINYAVTYSETLTDAGVSFTFTNGNGLLESADQSAYKVAANKSSIDDTYLASPSASVTATVGGTPAESVVGTSLTTVGTITVTITAG